MLERIERIRGVEYVITDAVDAKYQEMHADIASIYDLWREYRRKFVEYRKEDVRFAQSAVGEYERGSWEAIKHQYDAYKFSRYTAQEQDRLAIAFNTEVADAVTRMEERVEELEEWVEQGYLEWRGLLEELHELESQARQQEN